MHANKTMKCLHLQSFVWFNLCQKVKTRNHENGCVHWWQIDWVKYSLTDLMIVAQSLRELYFISVLHVTNTCMSMCVCFSVWQYGRGCAISQQLCAILHSPVRRTIHCLEQTSIISPKWKRVISAHQSWTVLVLSLSTHQDRLNGPDLVKKYVGRRHMKWSAFVRLHARYHLTESSCRTCGTKPTSS